MFVLLYSSPYSPHRLSIYHSSWVLLRVDTPTRYMNGIYKSCFQEFLNFFLHYVPKIGVHSSLRLAHRPGITFDMNVMGAQIRGDTLGKVQQRSEVLRQLEPGEEHTISSFN